jgi:NAD-dependent dihydropyrimidine dehydrogenase PreA subunit
MCVRNCPHGVFQIQEDPPRPTVTNPYNCLVACEACAKVCPNGAITFPTRVELKNILRKLREKYPLKM